LITRRLALAACAALLLAGCSRAGDPAAVAGYVMSAAYPYSAVVPVDGYSAALVERWRYLAGDQALTEQGLVKAGVYANRLMFSYGLLVRDTTGCHKRSVTDALTVPVGSA
jgi:hypothetical protein